MKFAARITGPHTCPQPATAEEEKQRPPNPVAPVKMACQQLCTYAYYSRGFTFKQLQANGNYGITAGPNDSLAPIFVKGWDRGQQYATISNGFARPKGATTPGTLLAFLPQGAEEKRIQPAGSHVVFIIRTSPRTSEAQFFDTGAAMEGSNRSKNGFRPLAATNFIGGNYDNRLFKGHVAIQLANTNVEFKGIGVLAPKTPSEILAAVERARRVRPLGMARLAIVKRIKGRDLQDDDVLYISPRIWMHDPDPASDANYYISRFLWSLRETPGYQDVEVIWQMSHPQDVPGGKDPFATDAFKATRTVPLKDIWGTGKRGNYMTFLTMSNDEDGKVIQRHRIKQKVSNKFGPYYVEEGVLEHYRAVCEFSYTSKSPDDGTKTGVAMNGMMRSIAAGADYRDKNLKGTFVVPQLFAPW